MAARAVMPEAAVDEDRDAASRPRDVGPARSAPPVQSVAAVPGVPESPSEDPLWSCVPRAVRLHDRPGRRGRGWRVRQLEPGHIVEYRGFDALGSTPLPTARRPSRPSPRSRRVRPRASGTSIPRQGVASRRTRWARPDSEPAREPADRAGTRPGHGPLSGGRSSGPRRRRQPGAARRASRARRRASLRSGPTPGRRASEAKRRPVSIAQVIRQAIDALPEDADRRSQAIDVILSAAPMPVPDDPRDLRREIDDALAGHP